MKCLSLDNGEPPVACEQELGFAFWEDENWLQSTYFSHLNIWWEELELKEKRRKFHRSEQFPAWQLIRHNLVAQFLLSRHRRVLAKTISFRCEMKQTENVRGKVFEGWVQGLWGLFKNWVIEKFGAEMFLRGSFSKFYQGTLKIFKNDILF